METSPLNLLILDENKMGAEPLKAYLNSKFGTQINISLFFEEEACVRSIDQNSSVIVLNYFLDKNDKTMERGLKVFNSIRKKKPTVEVIMMTSKMEGARAIDELQEMVTKYITRKEYYKKR